MNLANRTRSVLALAVLASSAAAAQAPTTLLVSANGAGQSGNKTSGAPAFSRDGRFVAFESMATDLVPSDLNAATDVFVRDLQTGLTERVSVGPGGTEANGQSFSPSISEDGRYVAFHSFASNLVPLDGNGADDVFVRDRATATTERVSLAADGTEAVGFSIDPSLSADGRYVAFTSVAGNLAPGDTLGLLDVYLRDRVLGTTVRVSVGLGGAEPDGTSEEASISADGRRVAYSSRAKNLIASPVLLGKSVFVHDLAAGTTTWISHTPDGEEGSAASSSYPYFYSETPAISADGRCVAFRTLASDLVPHSGAFGTIVLHDMASDTSESVSLSGVDGVAAFNAFAPSISADGRYVAFNTHDDLVAGDTNSEDDVYVRDRIADTTERASVATDGTQGIWGSYAGVLSADGRWVAFHSFAPNLAPFDFNGLVDVFARDRGCSPPWCDLGFGLAGDLGTPILYGLGQPLPASATSFHLSQVAAGTVGAHVLGAARIDLPLFGGVLVPDPFRLFAFATGAGGPVVLTHTWTPTLPSGIDLYLQSWLLDPAGAQGFAASNALHAQVP